MRSQRKKMSGLAQGDYNTEKMLARGGRIGNHDLKMGMILTMRER